MRSPRLLAFRDGVEAEGRLLSYGVPAAEARRLAGGAREFLLLLPGGEPSPGRLPPSLPRASGAGGEVLLFLSREDLPTLDLPGAREAVERASRAARTVPCGGKTLELGNRPAVMAILNVTPDSFSDGGVHGSPEEAADRAVAMAEAGADLVDVGGESTRPGSLPVPPEVQSARVLPVVRRLAARAPSLVVSVDTTSARVAEEALGEGADVVNDTSALADDPAMARVVRRAGAAVILVHRRGTPSTMQEAPAYRCFMKEMVEELEQGALRAVEDGIDPRRILLDPGIGFGKRPSDNLEAHRYLGDLVALGHPVVFGSSRKAFLGRIDGLPAPERLHTSVASAVLAAWNGASVLRVHDVAAARQALDLVAAVRGGASG